MNVKVTKTAFAIGHRWKPELNEETSKAHFGIAKRGALRARFSMQTKDY
jgi:hypothetical protein